MTPLVRLEPEVRPDGFTARLVPPIAQAARFLPTLHDDFQK